MLTNQDDALEPIRFTISNNVTHGVYYLKNENGPGVRSKTRYLIYRVPSFVE